MSIYLSSMQLCPSFIWQPITSSLSWSLYVVSDAAIWANAFRIYNVVQIPAVPCVLLFTNIINFSPYCSAFAGFWQNFPYAFAQMMKVLISEWSYGSMFHTLSYVDSTFSKYRIESWRFRRNLTCMIVFEILWSFFLSKFTDLYIEKEVFRDLWILVPVPCGRLFRVSHLKYKI